MCMCQHYNGQPNVNGQPGYAWNTEENRVRPVNPPDLGDGDELVVDLPGRCGGLDSHSHHFRVVKRYSSHYLLVRHGGGDERLDLGVTKVAIAQLLSMNETDCYWFCQMMHSLHRHAYDEGVAKERAVWVKAAADKRIKTRKQRGSDRVKVWIEPTIAVR